MDVLWRGLVARGTHVEPLERVGFVARTRLVEIVMSVGELGGELRDEVGGDFVATWANGRADRGKKMGGLAAEFELQAADCFLRDASEGAAPSGVNGGDGTPFWIDDENGNAVGGLDAQENAGAIGGGGVGFTGVGR